VVCSHTKKELNDLLNRSNRRIYKPIVFTCFNLPSPSSTKGYRVNIMTSEGRSYETMKTRILEEIPSAIFGIYAK
jgi:hypothetical protein